MSLRCHSQVQYINFTARIKGSYMLFVNFWKAYLEYSDHGVTELMLGGGGVYKGILHYTYLCT